MQRRRAFTLVEMLVAMALVIFIMVILAEAFTAGLETFRQLKAVGDMQQRLRSTASVLRRDLGADHFDGTRRLSDPNFGLVGSPQYGFFRIQAGGVYTLEGFDGYGVPSYRTTTNMLHFASKYRGNEHQEALSINFNTFPAPPRGPPPAPTFTPPDPTFYRDPGVIWAEVAYFLDPNPRGNAGSTPLYALYRRQLWVLPYAEDLNNYLNSMPTGFPRKAPYRTALWANAAEVSCQWNVPPGDPAYLYFNTERDLALAPPTTPVFRRSLMYGNPPPPLTLPNAVTSPTLPILIGGRGEAVARQGDDLVLTDVISFTVRVLLPGLNDFVDVEPNANNPGIGFPAFFYDTALINNPAANPAVSPVTRILALQITIRVWDAKTQQARQITIVQDL